MTRRIMCLPVAGWSRWNLIKIVSNGKELLFQKRRTLTFKKEGWRQ